MKKFEIEACLPVTATVTDVYQIEAKTKEEALEIFKSGNFDHVKCFIDSYGSDDLEMKDDVDYNELINSYNVIYPYKCMYRL